MIKVILCYFVTGSPERPKNIGVTILISCCWIASVTIVGLYTGNLIAFMTVQKSRLPIDSLEELAASSYYQAGIVYGEATYSLFQVCQIIDRSIFTLVSTRSPKLGLVVQCQFSCQVKGICELCHVNG